jgi:mannan endo-1,4-beta-mannosidase
MWTPWTRTAWILAAVALLGASASAAAAPDGFVERSGTHLVLDGRTFRFGGANVEWLGLAGYGPADPAGPHAPSRYEVDDAMATARELGVRVIRSQTMGDSVGCAGCIEPSLGRFDAAAFERIDYALLSARRHGLKVVPTLVGDDARAGGGGCVYLAWRGIDAPDCSLSYMPAFWTDDAVIGDVEQHIAALLDHVNVYTHVAYKRDPTILGWDLVNGGGSPAGWTRRIAGFVHRLDPRHLVLSGAANARVQGVDACVGFVYPHWSLPLEKAKPGIARCTRAGKPFIAYEYGWDRTNYPSLRAFRRFLDTLRRTPGVAGDAFWALQAHADGHGWMPIPADTGDPAVALAGESGEWWALYYPGIRTLVSTAADMAARAQAIRRHDYELRGLRAPPHALPPAPTAAVVVHDGSNHVYWQGSAGAKDYSVERRTAGDTRWSTVCRRCVTDADDGFVDADPAAAGASYRLVPFNLDGRPGPASQPAR